MAKRRKRKHPGVVLIRPEKSRRIGWRARFVDPDTGKSTKITLDRAYRTAELREDWARRKSRSLDKRRLELDGGAHRKTGTLLAVAVETYFDEHTHLRERTVQTYRSAATKFVRWASRTRVRLADDLTGPRLLTFRAELIGQKKSSPERGGKRGSVTKGGKARSAATINRELRSVGTILSYLRKRGLLPRISIDNLKDGLEKLPDSAARAEYRKPNELRALLDAAIRHDAAVFKSTRAEHVAGENQGSTPKHQAIAPFVAFVLLSGVRLGEALSLDWKQVDLEALDEDGSRVGEIHLRKEDTKTKRPRTVGLEVSPALRRMLAAMRLQNRSGSVFGLTSGSAYSAAARLQKEFGAPDGIGWQVLRRSCGTYLTNASGIFGGSSAYLSAKQLGHSVQVAERHYLGVMRGIRRDAQTLEAAMQIEKQMAKIVASVQTPRLKRLG
ncbi:MAG: hypothetical protein HRU17_14645 [Polyangiaceae bacterium]|nr:hypothetical protein [Polyangiaceae bacterium]